MRFDVEERERAKKDDNRKRGEDGREPPMTGGVVILRPFVGCGWSGIDFVSKDDRGDGDDGEPYGRRATRSRGWRRCHTVVRGRLDGVSHDKSPPLEGVRAGAGRALRGRII